MSCPLRPSAVPKDGADQQATENNGWWSDPKGAALAANFGIGTQAAQRPWKTGLRFSLKARMPSTRSAVPMS